MERTVLDSQAPAPDESALAAPTVAEAFVRTAAAYPDRVALRTRGGEREITWAEYRELVDRFAQALRDLGLGRGDTIALMLTNRPEFHIADAAALSLGVTPFSLYQTLAPDQIAYQVTDSAASIVVTEPGFLANVLEAQKSAPALRHVVIAGGEAGEGMLSFEELLETEADTEEIARAREAVQPDDLLTLIYTSGTTGPPKGVQITHGNIMSAMHALREAINFPEGSRVVSYLPMAHIAERATGHYLPIVLGHTVTTCPNPREVIAYLPEVRPTWFFAVPRIWEKLKAGMEAKMEAEPDAERKRGVEWALDVGHQKVRLEGEGKEVPSGLAEEARKADELVLSKIRAQLGLDDAEVLY